MADIVVTLTGVAGVGFDTGVGWGVGAFSPSTRFFSVPRIVLLDGQVLSIMLSSSDDAPLVPVAGLAPTIPGLAGLTIKSESAANTPGIRQRQRMPAKSVFMSII